MARQTMLSSIDRDALDAVMGQIRDEFGEDSICWAACCSWRIPESIASGLSDSLFEQLLGGEGLAGGGMISITGECASGKTNLVYMTMALVQQLGGVCVLFDVGECFDIDYAASLGVDPHSLVLVTLTRQCEVMRAASLLLKSGALNLIAIDDFTEVMTETDTTGLSRRRNWRRTRKHDLAAMTEELAELCHRWHTSCLVMLPLQHTLSGQASCAGGPMMMVWMSQQLGVRRVRASGASVNETFEVHTTNGHGDPTSAVFLTSAHTPGVERAASSS